MNMERSNLRERMNPGERMGPGRRMTLSVVERKWWGGIEA